MQHEIKVAQEVASFVLERDSQPFDRLLYRYRGDVDDAAVSPFLHPWQHCAHDLGALKRAMGEDWRDFEAYNVETASSPALGPCVSKLLELFARIPLAPALLRNISVPTTLVWGRHDRATPLSVAEAVSNRCGWPLCIIEDANDDPVVEQPEALLLLLRDLLSEAS